MLKLFFRYTAIVFCGNYIYKKLLNQNEYIKWHFSVSLFISIFITAVSYILSPQLQYFILPLLLLLTFTYLLFTTNTKPEVIFTTLILSYSICYFFFLLSISTLILLCSPMYMIFHFKPENFTIWQFFIGCLQCFLCTLPFRLKRLKNGMPFLQSRLISNIGVFVGSLILFCSMVLSTLDSKVSKNTDIFYLLLLPSIFVFSIFIFIWWKNQLLHTYLMKLKERELKRLEDQLNDCQETIASLENENQELSKLIHRDNKLIPSMQLAVSSFIAAASEESLNLNEKAAALLAQLEEEMKERSGVVTHLSQIGKRLTSTNVSAVDQLLNYMLHRGMADGITFDFSLSGNIVYFTEEIIQESDLLTLLADLLENAMIATKCNHGKQIFLHIGVVEGCYTIDVLDSGIPFPKEVLLRLGKKRYTTHKKTGGSGIGMVSTYELAQKYHASLIINETVSSSHLYTKKVSIVFDEKSSYHLISHRDSSELLYLKQRKDLKIND